MARRVTHACDQEMCSRLVPVEHSRSRECPELAAMTRRVTHTCDQEMCSRLVPVEHSRSRTCPAFFGQTAREALLLGRRQRLERSTPALSAGLAPSRWWGLGSMLGSRRFEQRGPTLQHCRLGMHRRHRRRGAAKPAARCSARSQSSASLAAAASPLETVLLRCTQLAQAGAAHAGKATETSRAGSSMR